MNSQRGLTFVELIVGLAVGVVVAAVSYFVFYPAITRFSSDFLDDFLSVVSQQTAHEPALKPISGLHTQPPTREPATPTPTGEEIVVFENLGEAMRSGLGLKCEFTSGGFKFTACTKDGKGRTDGAGIGVIMRDYSIWTWHKDSKQGVTATYTEEDLDKMLEGPSGELPSDWRRWEESVDDALFVPPSDAPFHEGTME